jgi:hypothetical protein
MSAQHSDDAREGEQTLTIKRSRSLPRRLRLCRALAGGDDFVLGAVANGFLELFGLLLDRAQAVLDGVVGRAEVGGDAANVDLWVVVSFACSGGGGEDAEDAHLNSARDDGGDEPLPDFDRVPGELAWAGHGW